MSDREALQAALLVGEVQLEAGVHVIDMPPAVGGRPRPYTALNVGASRLRGAGQGLTTLRFVGDAQQRDLYCLSLTTGEISDLTIETVEVTNTCEQTHAIHVMGPAGPTTIQRVTFDHPARATRCGDGIRVLGYEASIVVDVLVEDCTFLRCARSGVASHSGAHGLTIRRCKFVDVGDQDIDGEGTGFHRDWVITGNEFRLGLAPQGDYAIQLHKIDGVQIFGNGFWGRGVYALSGNNVEIYDNTIIRTTAASGVGAIQVDKASAGISIRENTIVRMASAGIGHVIQFMQRDVSAPSAVHIHHNTIIQRASGDVIYAIGTLGLDFARNTVIGNSGDYGLHLQGSPTTKVSGVHVVDNAWLGPMAGCVGINAGYAGCGDVTLAANNAFGPVRGLHVGNWNASTGPISSAGNHWPAAVGVPPGTEIP